MTDGDGNTKDSLTMLELWFPRIYISRIISGHHKQTNLPSAKGKLYWQELVFLLTSVCKTGTFPASRHSKKRKSGMCLRLMPANTFRFLLHVHEGIRTSDLPLRRSGQRSPTLSFQAPGNPSITTFLTARGCSHILRKTPNIPRKPGPKLAGR